ncbi:MAG TPA: helix-turn-helix transcriptional regulator [Syntrophobacter fumaroxidans]|nr:helix-turn-helix transcriptional regulator [Syntrophobacter fumaroxidans]
MGLKPHRLQDVRIKVALIEKGLVQREAAAKLGMVVSSFNMKLRGERPFTDKEKQKLAAVLGKPVEYLFSDTDPHDPSITSGENEDERANLP